MAIRIEQNPLTNLTEYVIDGFEQGIADAPELGLSDMRNINNDSQPGVALANYKLVSQTQIPVTGTPTSNSSNNTVTSTVAIQYGSLVTITGLAAQGITNGKYYFLNPSAVYAASGTVGKLYTTLDPASGYGGLVTITGSATGTIIFSVSMGIPKDYTIDPNRTGKNFNYYIIDDQGQVWTNIVSSAGGFVLNIWTILVGNSIGQGAPNYAYGNGIVFYRKYLFIFRDKYIDIWDAYGQEGTPYSWSNGAFTMAGPPVEGSKTSHKAILGNNDVVYFTNGNLINTVNQTGGVLLANFTITAVTPLQNLTLPTYEIANNIVEPSIDTSNGGYLYIGTSTSNLVYPWQRFLISTTSGATAYDSPLVMPEVGTYQMLNINRVVYILAGQRGNIYYTNGSTVQILKSIPKQPTKNPYSTFQWGGIMSLNNNLCFGAADATVTGGTQNNASGCWSITLSISQYGSLVAGAIRYKGQPSGGIYNTTVLIPQNDSLTYFAGWYNGTYGGIDVLDTATPTFYTYGTLNSTPPGSFIETDIINIGTAYNPKTLSSVEAKLDTALVAGEKFRVSMRNNFTDTYALVFEQTDTGALFGKSDSGLPKDDLEWVQFKIELQTIPSGSFVRLKELRFR